MIVELQQPVEAFYLVPYDEADDWDLHVEDLHAWFASAMPGVDWDGDDGGIHIGGDSATPNVDVHGTGYLYVPEGMWIVALTPRSCVSVSREVFAAVLRPVGAPDR